MGDYGSFLADYCSKLNKGAAKLAACGETELNACASALFIGEKSILLGAVATRESARGNGYASKLVKALADSFEDKTVYLFAATIHFSVSMKKSVLNPTAYGLNTLIFKGGILCHRFATCLQV